MNYFEITEDLLPTKFSNLIISNKQNVFVIRSSLKNMDDINEWVSDFGKKSFTQWNVRSSVPGGEKIVCSKKFICHQSAFMKVPKDKNKKGISKNALCKASIHVVVKLNTKNTRRKDEFVKRGLQGVIKIENHHTHTLLTADTLRFLQGDNKLKNKFFDYFDDGMTISEAIKYHELLLKYKENEELLLASGSTNPTYRTVQNWYNQWRTLGPRTGTEMIEDSEMHNVSNEDTLTPVSKGMSDITPSNLPKELNSISNINKLLSVPAIGDEKLETGSLLVKVKNEHEDLSQALMESTSMVKTEPEWNHPEIQHFSGDTVMYEWDKPEPIIIKSEMVQKNGESISDLSDKITDAILSRYRKLLPKPVEVPVITETSETICEIETKTDVALVESKIKHEEIDLGVEKSEQNYSISLEGPNQEKSKEYKKHNCHECNYQTTRKGNLTRHLLRHKNPEEINMYRCHRCDFKSIHERSWKAHVLRHDPKIQKTKLKNLLFLQFNSI